MLVNAHALVGATPNDRIDITLQHYGLVTALCLPPHDAVVLDLPFKGSNALGLGLCEDIGGLPNILETNDGLAEVDSGVVESDILFPQLIDLYVEGLVGLSDDSYVLGVPHAVTIHLG